MSSVYAEPKRGLSLDQAKFYHRLDLPELEDKSWLWDLRGRESDYLGGFDFAGKRVLEFGTANGALSFWMEKQGAEVVTVDLSPDVEKTSWDLLLFPDDDVEEIKKTMSEAMELLNNGFWYAHERFQSQVKLVHGTAYQIPHEVGMFDVVTTCAILLHLRDPFGALENVLNHTRKYVIITDLVPFRMTEEDLKRPLAWFMPTPEGRKPHGGWTWWHVSPEAYVRYLKLKGFAVKSLTRSKYRHEFKEHELFTIVAEREQTVQAGAQEHKTT